MNGVLVTKYLHTMIRVGDLEIDTNRKSASRGGEPLDLTAREFQILSYLMLRQGRIVPLRSAGWLRRHASRRR